MTNRPRRGEAHNAVSGAAAYRKAPPSLGLVMIVRNEALTLPRLAASVRGKIDRFTIVDTGSTDGTPEIAARLFAGLPGEVVEDTWRGFGPSRNVALRAAEAHTDWVLSLDADETLCGRVDRALLVGAIDGVALQCRSGTVRSWLPRLLACGRGWAWRGRTHEFLALEDGEANLVRARSPWVEHHGDGGARSDKYTRDLVLLGEDWDECEGDPRTAFYIARTYDDIGHPEEAVEWYRRRVGLGGWEEETWYASYRLGACLVKGGMEQEGRLQLLAAAEQRPWRAEPLAGLAEHCRVRGDWPAAWRACQQAFATTAARPFGTGPSPYLDSLFVDADVHDWQVAYEASMAAWYVGEKARGRALSSYVLSRAGVPDVVRRAVTANRTFYRA